MGLVELIGRGSLRSQVISAFLTWAGCQDPKIRPSQSGLNQVYLYSYRIDLANSKCGNGENPPNSAGELN